MSHHPKWQSALLATLAFAALCHVGCTRPKQYFDNHFKVGPDYCRPQAAVAGKWIDAADVRVRSVSDDISRWWTVFKDPALDRLMHEAYSQNLTLREAGCRVLESRAQLDIAIGTLFPQQQTANGSYQRSALNQNYTSRWSTGFNLAWELDFWGRFRRAIASADAQLDASVESYDDVLVTLLGDVANNYTQYRTLQERLRLLRENVRIQQDVLAVVTHKLEAGSANEIDQDQSVSNLRQAESQIEQLEVARRQTMVRLCILLGQPPEDLDAKLGDGPIPTTPSDVVVGIPADLLRRRPDVRRAERDAAAQAEMIGIAMAQLYPAFSVTGSVGYQAQDFRHLFSQNAFVGSVGPSFQWNVLNYGRIANDVRLQDARFLELVTIYQQTVLDANGEVEEGLVAFLRAQERARLLDESVRAAQRAVHVLVLRYQEGKEDFLRYAVMQQNLITQQDSWAQSRGEIAQGLIVVYRALGGGWQIRLEAGQGAAASPSAVGNPTPAPMPAPMPENVHLPAATGNAQQPPMPAGNVPAATEASGHGAPTAKGQPHATGETGPASPKPNENYDRKPDPKIDVKSESKPETKTDQKR
jgi:NodT family efflux transporter outer membrane factor (OMF) lipoprotein